MAGSNLIDRAEFLARRDKGFPFYEEVEVPELGRIWVKCLNAGEQDRFEQQHEATNHADFRARIVAHCCITEQGARLFSDEDIPELTLFPPGMLDPIVQVAVRINGWSKLAQDATAKNLNGQGGSF